MLHFLRAFFVVFAGIISWSLGNSLHFSPEGRFIAILCGMALGTSLILLEIQLARRFIGLISVVMFGLVFGFVVAFLITNALLLLPMFTDLDRADNTTFPLIRTWVQFTLTFACCYLSVVAILQSRDDFKLVIPFVEFSRHHQGPKPLVLDTSAVIDARIIDIVEKGVLDLHLLVPRFVLSELQALADSSDRTKRSRGRRGLDTLDRLLKSNAGARIYEVEVPEVRGVDSKLVHLCRKLDARLATTDFNLAKVASLEQVEVLNINDLADALRPPVLPGDQLRLEVVRAGEEAGQGVGYLPDGTMVVVGAAAGRVGSEISAVVTGMIRTSAGRMVFADLQEK